MPLPQNLEKYDPLVLLTGDNKREPQKVVVSRVGTRYVYVTLESGGDVLQGQFDRVTGAAKENVGWARYLVTPEQYEEILERRQLLVELRTAGVEIDYKQREKVTLAQLRGLLAVMQADPQALHQLADDLMYGQKR